MVAELFSVAMTITLISAGIVGSGGGGGGVNSGIMQVSPERDSIVEFIFHFNMDVKCIRCIPNQKFTIILLPTVFTHNPGKLTFTCCHWILFCTDISAQCKLWARVSFTSTV